MTHTYTNPGGAFATVPLPAATYQAETSVPGCLLGGPITVQLTGAPPRADFTLTVDPRSALSTLFGLTYNAQSNTRLADAAVVLSLPDGSAVATTLSNSVRQYRTADDDRAPSQNLPIDSAYRLSENARARRHRGYVALRLRAALQAEAPPFTGPHTLRPAPGLRPARRPKP